MRGERPTLRDINLDLQDLVMPDNLLSGEVLDPEEELEEVEPRHPYSIVTECNNCSGKLRLHVVTTSTGIRDLQELFFRNLSLLCCTCARVTKNGRS